MADSHEPAAMWSAAWDELLTQCEAAGARLWRREEVAPVLVRAAHRLRRRAEAVQVLVAKI